MPPLLWDCEASDAAARWRVVGPGPEPVFGVPIS